MDNDFTVTAALYTAFAAIIAPTITALIHSIKEYRVKKLEQSYSEKVVALKNLTAAYDRLRTETNYSYASQVQKAALDLAVLCKRSKTRTCFISLAELVMKEKKRTAEIEALYFKSIKHLSSEL